VTRIRRFASLATLAFSLPSGLSAQDPQGTLAQVESRTLVELVAALPGRPTGLQMLVGTALERSLDLEGEIFNRRIAEASVDIQGGLFDPSLRLGSSLARSGTPGVASARAMSAGLGAVLPWGTELGVDVRGGRNLGLINDPSSVYDSDLTVTLSQPILDGFNVNDARYRAAQRQRRAAEHALARATELVIAQIETLYWSLAEAEALEAVRQGSYQLAQALLFRNQQLAERGLVAAVDVLTAQSGVALRRASLIDAKRRRLDASDRLVFAAYGAGAAQQLRADTLPVKTTTTLLGGDPIEVERPGAAMSRLPVSPLPRRPNPSGRAPADCVRGCSWTEAGQQREAERAPVASSGDSATTRHGAWDSVSRCPWATDPTAVSRGWQRGPSAFAKSTSVSRKT
jgi:outer membrane protein TolC